MVRQKALTNFFLINNSGENIFLKSIETNDVIKGIKQMFEL